MTSLYQIGFLVFTLVVCAYLAARIERAVPDNRALWVLLFGAVVLHWIFQMLTFMYMYLPERADALLEHEATPPSRAMPAELAGLDLDAVQAQLGKTRVLSKEQRRNPSECSSTELFAPVFWGRTTLEHYHAFLETDFAKWHAKQCSLQASLAAVVHEYEVLERPPLRYLSGWAKPMAYVWLPARITNNPEIARRIAAVKKEQE